MRIALYFIAIMFGFAAASSAQAYVGPGIGLGTLGAIAGFAMSILIALVAVVWFPLKRLFGKKKPAKPAQGNVPVNNVRSDA